MTTRSFGPYIKKMGFLFLSSWGFENREDVMKTLLNFFSDHEQRVSRINGLVYICGQEDGHEITEASTATQIEREGKPENEHFIITTKYGRRFYFLEKDLSDETIKMFEDLIRYERLNTGPWYYCPENRRSKSYL